LSSPRLDAILFGETQSRIIISVAPENAERVLGMARQAGVPAVRVGTIGGQKLTIKTAPTTLTWEVHYLHLQWFHSIANAMQV
jgi:phosphoribosylformylglycinamidine synthase subunit PurL